MVSNWFSCIIPQSCSCVLECLFLLKLVLHCRLYRVWHLFPYSVWHFFLGTSWHFCSGMREVLSTWTVLHSCISWLWHSCSCRILSFCTSSCFTSSLCLPLDSRHCCFRCPLFLTLSQDLYLALGLYLILDPCWLTGLSFLHSVVQLNHCALLLSQLSC